MFRSTTQRPTSVRYLLAVAIAAAALLGVTADAEAATFTVTTISEFGNGTLQRAILDANANPGPDTIVFTVTNTAIGLTTSLPAITESVVIDATSPAGYVELYLNTPSPVAGLVIDAPDVTVRGLTFTGFTLNPIQVTAQGSGAVLDGNRYGLRFNGTPRTNTGTAVVVQAPNVTISNSVICRSTGLTAAGIEVEAGGAGATIVGNLIGVRPDGVACALPTSAVMVRASGATLTDNVIGNSADYGVVLNNVTGATLTGNHIGVYQDADHGNADGGVQVMGGGGHLLEGNTISGNDNAGLRFVNGTTGNTARANRVGVTVDGLTFMPNSVYGVLLDSAPNNTLDGNVIVTSGANSSVQVTSSSGARLLGNTVGFNAAYEPYPSAPAAITVTGASASVDIQDNTAQGRIGVRLTGAGVSSASVRNNFIGFDPGSDAVGDAQEYGVLATDVRGAVIDANLVAGSGSAIDLSRVEDVTVSNNLIGFSQLTNAGLDTGAGLTLTDAVDADVRGNRIVATTGRAVSVVGLSSAGVALDANLIGLYPDSTIGGSGDVGVLISSAPGVVMTGNTIAGSAGEGVRVVGTSGQVQLVGNAIHDGLGVGVVINNPTARALLSQNSIHDNAGIGIDLQGSVGPETNDPLDADDGANGLQNHPVLHRGGTLGGQASIKGSLFSKPSTQYVIECFESAAFDPTGYGEGERFLNAMMVTTDAAGFAGFELPFSATIGGYKLSCTAHDPVTFESSEFSRRDQPPTVDGPASVSTNEDAALAFGLPDVVVVDDPDAGYPGVIVQADVTRGRLALSETSGLTVLSGAVDGSLAGFAVEGTLEDLNAALASMVYTPQPDDDQDVTLNVRIEDGAPASIGGSLAATTSVTIDLIPVNDPPAGVGESYSVDEDGHLARDPSLGVLANDVDIDGGALSATVLIGPTHGTLDLDPSGAFDYFPATDYNGDDSFTYTVSDGQGGSDTATVTLTINPVNDDPAPVDDAHATDEDTPLVVDAAAGVLGDDIDVEGDALSATLASPPTHGAVVLASDGSFTYTPDADYNGADSFTYTASDGQGGSATATVTLTINPVNDAPVAADDVVIGDEDAALNFDVRSNDADLEDDALMVDSATTPASGVVVVAPDGTLTYTPAADYNGNDSFTYTVSDGQGGSDVATVTLTINPVNDAPRFVAPTPDTSGGPLSVLDSAPLAFTVAADDVDGDALTLSAADVPPGAGFDASAGAFSWTPTVTQAGSWAITFTVSDGVEQAERVVSLEVSFSDADDDGLPDVLEDALGLDPAAEDSDGDSISDGDELGPDLEAPSDVDGDEVIDALDDDSDDDGLLDADEAGDEDPSTAPIDTDSDGVADFRDADSDDDGVDDVDDNCPLVDNADQVDTDGDGQGDLCADDADGDGVLDDADSCPLIANADQANADGDELGDACDADDDNDGVNDDVDSCPLVEDADQLDTDGDAQGDACDEDDDDDGLVDEGDSCPLEAADTADGCPDPGDGDVVTDGDVSDGDVSDGDVSDGSDTSPGADVADGAGDSGEDVGDDLTADGSAAEDGADAGDGGDDGCGCRTVRRPVGGGGLPVGPSGALLLGLGYLAWRRRRRG